MITRILRASLLLIPFTLLSVPALAQVSSAGPGEQPPVDGAKPAELAPPASLLDVDLNRFEEDLRWTFRDSQHLSDQNLPQPLGPNPFPYSRSLHYECLGMEIWARQIGNRIVKIAITIPWNARTESLWPVVVKSLNLPADTPRPGTKPEITQREILEIPGEGRNWVAICSPGNVTTLFVGEREFFGSVVDLINDNAKDEIKAKVIQGLFSSALRK